MKEPTIMRSKISSLPIADKWSILDYYVQHTGQLEDKLKDFAKYTRSNGKIDEHLFSPTDFKYMSEKQLSELKLDRDEQRILQQIIADCERNDSFFFRIIT